MWTGALFCWKVLQERHKVVFKHIHVARSLHSVVNPDDWSNTQECESVPYYHIAHHASHSVSHITGRRLPPHFSKYVYVYHSCRGRTSTCLKMEFSSSPPQSSWRSRVNCRHFFWFFTSRQGFPQAICILASLKVLLTLETETWRP
jgi:hypothetical protein